MQFTREARTDLVISMTLAEVFLLLLFVIWFGYTTILDDPKENALLKEQNKRLKNENSLLINKLNESEKFISELKKRLEIWRNLTGFEHPPSKKQLDDWIKEAGRGHPKCQENNILISAKIISGKITMIIVNRSPRLSYWANNNGLQLPEPNQQIKDKKKIYEFLNLISTFYSDTKTEEIDCRFDYTLTYKSKEDYFDGRQLFERYFYPAKISQTVKE